MKSVSLGIGIVAGAALAFTAVNSLYPDVMRRMKKDGTRALRSVKRAAKLN